MRLVKQLILKLQMKHNWIETSLGELLKLNVDSVDVNAQPEFHFAGVYCFGNGLFEKGYQNNETSYKTFNRLHKNQIVVSKVKVWEGAIALVTDEFEGMFLSPVYPTFELISDEKANLKFIHYYLQQEQVWQQLLDNSKGIGARRNSVSEEQFLKLKINLPDKRIQNALVSKIELIQAKVEEIKQLRLEMEKEINDLRYNLFIKLQEKYNSIRIGDFLIPQNRSVTIQPNIIYKQVTVSGNHRGVTLRCKIKGSEIGSKQYLAKEGDFIISKIDARNAAMGMISKELDEAVVTGDFPLFGFKEIINPLFFYHFSNTPFFDMACKEASEGTTNRVRLKMDRFYNIQIPLPPNEEQNRIVELLEKMNKIKQSHKEQEAELKQLMPSLLNKAFKGEL